MPDKDGKLTPEEWTEMKTHTTLGYEILKHSERRLLKAAAIVANEHHEKWDGTGYPNGTKGKKIHVTVKNSATKRPVVEAQVTISGCGVNETQATNGKGKAFFRRVVPTVTGTMEVFVRKDGYTDERASIEVK